MSNIRAVITGMGPISSIGIGVESFWNGLISGKSGIGRLARFVAPDGVSAKFSAEIPNFEPERWLPAARMKRMDRFIQLGVCSSRLALEDASLALEDIAESPRVGVCFGSAVGGFAGAEGEHERFLREGVSSLSPSLAARVFGASAHTQVCQDLSIHGPGATNWNSCAAGNCALGDALSLIRSGAVDVVIAGGVEAPLSPLVFSSFDKLRTMSRRESPDDAMKPFDQERDGFVMGEGAACLIIESERHAQTRGARVYAELAGFGMSHEGHHPTTPEPSAVHLESALLAAARSAGRNLDEITLISAHGSATQWNDPNEIKATQRHCGADFGKTTFLSAIKPNIGHTLGAGGAFEAMACALSIQSGKIPPILNLDQPIDLGGMVAPSEALVDEKIEAAINISLGFGGINSASILLAT